MGTIFRALFGGGEHKEEKEKEEAKEATPAAVTGELPVSCWEIPQAIGVTVRDSGKGDPVAAGGACSHTFISYHMIVLI